MGILKSDGTAVACGDNGQGQCDLPALEEGVMYVTSRLCTGPRLILQASFGSGDCTTVMCFHSLGGVQQCQLSVQPTEKLSDLLVRLASSVGGSQPDVVLP